MLPMNDTPAITPTEKAYLADLDDSQVRSWAMARIEECAARMRSLGTIYNNTTLMNSMLPNEIMMQIFCKTQPSERRGDRGLRLLHICRLWRRLLIATPEYWVDLLAKPRTYLDPMSQHQEDRLRFSLELTRGLPFSLSFEYSHLPHRLAQIVEPYHHRVTSLNITAIEKVDGSFIKALLGNGMPLLEHLSVEYARYLGPNAVPVPRLEQSLFPRLKTLKHSFEPIDLGDVRNQLRGLELCHYPKPALLLGGLEPALLEEDMVAVLRQIVRCCPSLEKLCLNDILPSFPIEPPEPIFALPNTLRKIRIIENHGDTLANFLSCITYPPTCVLDIRCHDSMGLHSFACGLLREGTQIYLQLHGADEIRLSLTRPRDWALAGTIEAMSSGARRLCIETRLVGATEASVFADFAVLFNRPFLNTTSLQINSADPHASDDARDNLRTLLASFVNLIRLDVRGHDGRYHIVALLEEPAGPSGACACLRLEELRIDWLYAEEEASKPREDGYCPISAPKVFRFDPAVSAMFCDTIERMAQHRRISGAPLKRLAVGLDFGRDTHYVDDKQWDSSALRVTKRLQDSLRHVAENVDVFHHCYYR